MSELSVVLSDPCWSFKTYSKKGAKKSPKYDVMSFDELSALRPTIRAVSGKNSVHCMWVTAPFLEEGILFMAQWGITYKTFRMWHKDRIGTGYYVRNDAEIVLIGTTGKTRLPIIKERTVFRGKPAEKKHSSKPECIHQWIERGWPDARKVELFARRHRNNWECIGSDLGLLITPKGIETIDRELSAA